jgi:hypothetical protein
MYGSATEGGVDLLLPPRGGFLMASERNSRNTTTSNSRLCPVAFTSICTLCLEKRNEKLIMEAIGNERRV